MIFDFSGGSIDLGDVVRSYNENGYVILDGVYAQADIDEVNSQISTFLAAGDARYDFDFHGMKEDGKDVSLPYSKFRMLSEQDRSRYVNSGSWRIHNLIEKSSPIRKLAFNDQVLDVVKGLVGVPATPAYSINFYWGSTQALHQDDAVFHISPLGHLVGSWIALQDVDSESGPLIFYPKSHLEGLYPGFPDHPNTNLRTSDDATFDAYYKHVYDVAHPLRQNRCRLHRSTLGAEMKDERGSIRTSIQGQSGGAVAAAGERGAGRGGAGSGHWSGDAGAVARGCAVQARPRAGLDCGRPA